MPCPKKENRQAKITGDGSESSGLCCWAFCNRIIHKISSSQLERQESGISFRCCLHVNNEYCCSSIHIYCLDFDYGDQMWMLLADAHPKTVFFKDKCYWLGGPARVYERVNALTVCRVIRWCSPPPSQAHYATGCLISLPASFHTAHVHNIHAEVMLYNLPASLSTYINLFRRSLGCGNDGCCR